MFKLVVYTLIRFATIVSSNLIKSEIYHGRNVGSMVNNEVYNSGIYRYMARWDGIYDYKHNNGTISVKYRNCGAILIRLHVAITAAHCLDDLNMRNITMEVGVVNTKIKQKSSQIMEAIDYVIHKDYQLLPYPDNDIGLIFFPKPFIKDRFVKPIKISKNDTYEENLKVKIIGWGRNEHGERPEWLQKTNHYIVDHEKCQNVSKTFVSNNMICAKDKNERSTVCRGDSGGPLIRGNRLIGIVSRVTRLKKLPSGQTKCDPNFPSVFTNVNKYSSWIKDEINNNKKKKRI